VAHAPAEALEPRLAELAERPGAETATVLAGDAWQRVKRPVDFVIAAVVMIALAPVMLLVALAVTFSSPGPVLFRQRRYGLGLEPFTMLKFRTMADGAPTELHEAFITDLAHGTAGGEGLKKLVADPRITTVGRWLRRTSLDELPQLFNVLAGHMSLVGPRPAIPYELDHYGPEHFERFLVRPGLTGLWQVSGRATVGFTEMLDLDVDYVHRAGAMTDLAITIRTPLAVLTKRTA
jgi:lipopolysaccharide/colanic/teichoic acid biosynthesis glycosyltransferase